MKHSTSLFGQMISLISRTKFAELVKKHGSDRHSKGFTSWTHMVSMLFCQLAQAKSLREICKGLQTCVGKLNHLGVGEAPKRSTLSYANANRPWELYKDLFYQLLEKVRKEAPGKKRKFRFKNKLMSLDATVIDLCEKVFDWAKYRKKKGAVKLHMLLDHEGYLPMFAHITEGREHEIKTARGLDLPEDSIVAMDRGYYDFSLFQKWTDAGVWFVTRLKKNASFGIVETRDVPQNRNIMQDQLIRFTSKQASEDCPSTLRRILVWDEKNDCTLVLLTNHLDFGATTIAKIYKDRWEIEQFFRALKQNLKVKTFVGTSANALRIQIWTALIGILLIKYLQFRSKRKWSLSNLVALLHWNLFSYRGLWDWINDPFNTPPEPAEYHQIPLPFLDSKSANIKNIAPSGG